MRKLASWPLVVLLLFMCFAAIDLSLRFGLGLGSPLLYMRDDAAGYLPAPNQHLFRFFNHVDIDGNSMRSDDAPADAELRVLFIGDSVTFGTTYVDQGAIFASLVEHTAPASCGGVKTTMAAAGGWAVQNELGWLRSRGVGGADVVALVINTGDFDQGFSELPNTPDFPTKGYALATLELVTRYLPRLAALVLPTSPHDEDVTTPQPEAAAIILDAIRAARGIVESAGARFILIYSPTIHAGFERYRVAAERFHDFVREEHIDLVDMTDAFAAHSQKAIYFDGTHLRPLAHRLITERFVTALDRIGVCKTGMQSAAQ